MLVIAFRGCGRRDDQRRVLAGTRQRLSLEIAGLTVREQRDGG